MNDSKHGFVYFTFGSMVMIETFPEYFLKVLYTSLGKIAPVRVLMKVPNPEKLPPNLPSNVHTFRWIPQLKVLSELPSYLVRLNCYFIFQLFILYSQSDVRKTVSSTHTVGDVK